MAFLLVLCICLAQVSRCICLISFVNRGELSSSELSADKFLSDELLSLRSGPECHSSCKLGHAPPHAHSHAECDGGGEERLREKGLLGAGAIAGDRRSPAAAPARRPVDGSIWTGWCPPDHQRLLARA